jgi:hypothetical protein
MAASPDTPMQGENPVKYELLACMHPRLRRIPNLLLPHFSHATAHGTWPAPAQPVQAAAAAEELCPRTGAVHLDI